MNDQQNTRCPVCGYLPQFEGSAGCMCAKRDARLGKETNVLKLMDAMYEARRQVKNFVGSSYDDEMIKWKNVVTGRAYLREISHVAAATELYNSPALHNDIAMQFLFCAVLELIEDDLPF